MLEPSGQLPLACGNRAHAAGTTHLNTQSLPTGVSTQSAAQWLTDWLSASLSRCLHTFCTQAQVGHYQIELLVIRIIHRHYNKQQLSKLLF